MAPPDTFQHYQLLRREDGRMWELGRGSMGVTYKALDTNLRSPVALKVVNGMFLHDEVARGRFLREARAAAQLRHRNVASVYHLCEDGEHFFYAMEFIDGETVEAWVQRAGPLPVATALDITLQATRALGAAARQRLVHRDVKPANLMVVHEDADEGFVVKLIDFGLARSFHGGDSLFPAAHATVAGFHGTPAFASPEQLNEQELDARSDIYSLGVTLWFMLAGEPPFTGKLAVLYQQHLHAPLPWERLAGTPEPVRTLLRHMLEKDPDGRPQSPPELREELTRCLRAISATVPGAAEAATEAGTVVPAADPAVNIPPTGGAPRGHDTAREEPAPGLRLADGLRLGPLVGEGNHGQVFQAQDPRGDHARLAVKVFHPETLSDARFEALRERFHRLRATPPHPNLLKIFTLGHHRHLTYATMEWVEGFSLISLLRKRGTLTVAECLGLLQQVAAAGAHARTHGLHGLELAPHQILVDFPGAHRAGGPDRDALLRDPLTEWPEFTLKVDALNDARAGHSLATWSGEITLVPDPTGSRLVRPEPGSETSAKDGVDLRALGILVYELLGGSGAPPLLRIGSVAAVPGSERHHGPPPLPILGEAGNAILRRCLSGEAGFRDEADFFNSLAQATGFDPGELRRTRTHLREKLRPVPILPTVAPTATAVPEAPPPPAAARSVVPAGGREKTAAASWKRLAEALPAGSPRRRRWACALVALALIPALTNLAWWLLDAGSAPSAPPPAASSPPRVAVVAAPPVLPAPFAPAPESSPPPSPPGPPLVEAPVPTGPPPALPSPVAPTPTPPGLLTEPGPAPTPTEIRPDATPRPPADPAARRPGLILAPDGSPPPPPGSSAAASPPADAPVLPADSRRPKSSGAAAPFVAAESSPTGTENVPEFKKSSIRPRKPTGSSSRSHRHRERRRQPNFLERIFGARPR